MKNSFKKIIKISLQLILIISLIGSNLFSFPNKVRAAGETRTKTVEYFVGMNTASGTGQAANSVWTPASFTVNLPDAISSPTMIKSAWIDFTFQSAATTAPGVVTLTLTPSGGSTSTFTSASYLSSAENYTIRIKPDFTAAMQAAQQTAGSKAYTFTAKVAGVATKMASAKMFITYDYNSTATTQLNTVHYMVGQTTGNTAVGTTGVTFTSPSLVIAENSPTIVSAWSEIRGQVPATGTTDSTFKVNYDADVASTYYLDNAGSTNSQAIYILHPKNNITLNTTHTLKVAATTGYQMNLVSAEQVITYTFNYTDSTTLTNSREVLLGSDGTKASSTPLDTTTTINIPEDGVSFKNIFMRGTAHSATSGSYGVAAKLGSSPPTPSISYTQTVSTETMNNFWILSDDINDLDTMVQGDNQISSTFTGTMTSRASQLLITYTYLKSSSTTIGNVLVWAEQQTAYGTVDTPSVNVSISGNFDTNYVKSFIWANSVNGVTQDRVANISTQPTGTTTYNWNSTGEYQWILFFHSNEANEIPGNGTYTINLGSTGNNVMAAVVGVSFRYLSLSPPTVTTPTHTSVTSTSAILGANVTSLGIPALISARGTCWGTSPLPTTNCLDEGGTTDGMFTHLRTGLSPNTLYYYRGYATNTTGTAYSSDGSFTTLSAGLPIGGTLTSSVFDTTSNSSSIGYNSIMWKGTAGTGKVLFQLATSSSPSGPWNYYGGSTCGALDWFESLGPDNPIELKGSTCFSNWNNKRYFRYKVKVCSGDCVIVGTETPIINKIIVNWSS